MILQPLARLIFEKCLGWRTCVTVPNVDKCIICVAPHTSNWDFPLAELFYTSIGRKAGFLMKKEWFFFPLGILLKAIGGIPVHRSHKSSLVEQLIERCNRSNKFHVAITPEATRSKNTEWKQGFYHIAKGANIPIILYGIDYKNKIIYGEKMIIPGNDTEADIRSIKEYYSHFDGLARHPEKFTIGNL